MVRALRPHAPALGVAAALAAAVAAARGGTVVLVREALDRALVGDGRGPLLAVTLGLVGVHALHAGAELGRTALTKRVGMRVTAALRSRLFARFQALSLRQQAGHPTGDVMARLTHDTACAQWAVGVAVTAVQRPLTLLVLAAAAVWHEPALSLVAALVFPGVAALLAALGGAVRRASRAQARALGELSAGLQEVIAGQRVVKLSSAEGRESRRFAERSRAQLRALQRAVLSQAVGSPAVELVAAASLGAVLWIGGNEVLAGRSSPGSLVAFLVALGLMTEPLKGLAQVQALWLQAVASAERVYALEDEAPEVADPPGAAPLSGRALAVELQDVDFSWAQGRPALRGVSLTARPGEVVALVGESGAGKSSVLSLVPRLADPDAGAVRVGGRDVRGIPLASLRAHVAVVSQDTFLFNDTVRANIAYGREGATPAEVEEAARRAHADAFVRALPEGYDTVLGERGERLSGGQRQRIAIARALLRDAPVLLLDEATSHLDSASEAEVQAAVDELVRDRTVLVAAHRLSTVRGADRIVVLRDGAVVETGTHAELVARRGEYGRLWALQAGEGTPPARAAGDEAG